MTIKTPMRLAAIGLMMLAFESSAMAAAAKQTVSPALAPTLQAAQKALAAKNFAEANTQLAKAAAVPKQTPYESYVIAQMKAQAAIGLNDYKSAQTDYESVLAYPDLAPADKLQAMELYIKLTVANKDFAKMATGIQQYKAAGGTNTDLTGQYATALFLSGNYAAASTEVTNQINAEEAAHQRPTDMQLQLLANCALKTNNAPAYLVALEKTATYAPTKPVWLELIVRTQAKQGVAQALDLDFYRLRRATGTMEKANDYVDAAQLSQAGYPGEAQKFVDEGFQRGLLGTGADAAAHKTLKDNVARKVAADKSTLAEGEKAAEKQPSGDAMVATGYNYVVYGDAAKGIPIMEAGIKKGGLKLPEHAKLHLGYAYLLAGNKDQAYKTFATVQGNDGARDLARLWTIQMRAPAAPAAAPAAPASAAPTAAAPAAAQTKK